MPFVLVNSLNGGKLFGAANSAVANESFSLHHRGAEARRKSPNRSVSSLACSVSLW